jgi:hypothetical protein
MITSAAELEEDLTTLYRTHPLATWKDTHRDDTQRIRRTPHEA